MDTIQQDIRHAMRRLFKSPGFTLIGTLTLALGIGANSAIFSVVNAVLLRPLPYSQPDRLVGIYHFQNGERATMSGPNFVDVKRMSKTLADAAAVARSRVVLTGEGEPSRLTIAEVSASLFDLLGVQPLQGRGFHSEENEPGHNKVAVLSYPLWHQRFGGDRRVIGKTIVVDGVSTEIVGVMPEGFAFPSDTMLWIPLEYTKEFTTTQRAAWYLDAVGRVKPGIPIEHAAAEIDAIGKQLAKQYPDADAGLDITAVSLHEAMVGDIRKAVLVLLGAVGFVLLIACTNVANLLLARAASRETEMAVRSALGAARGRLVRQLLTESVLLGAAGGTLGLLFAFWGVDALVALQPAGIPRLSDVHVDRWVVLFTFAVSIATGLIFGVVPALHSTGASVAGGLKDAGRGALTSRAGSRVRGVLVIAEVALAVVLLVGAGLLIRSFVKLTSVDPGFHAAQALTFELSLPESRYPLESQQVDFFGRLLTNLHAVPGVDRAAAVISLPLSGSSIVLSFEIAGRPPLPVSQQPVMQVRVATNDYFRAIGIPLKRGRIFTDDDRPGSPPVVVITESAARQYFPGDDPIGKKITLGWGRGPGKPRAGGVVVGIIGDVKDSGLDEPNPPQLYLPYQQWPVHSMSVLLKTVVPAAAVADAARRAVYATDPNIPISSVRTLDQIVAKSISQPYFYATLLAVFAVLALALAAIGVFGVLSYAVAQRTREIGIRMALGAQERNVLTLIVRQAMTFAVVGVALGSGLALTLARPLVAKMLFNTSPHDAATFCGVALVLAAVALVASYIPARRATRVDPIVALRSE